MNGEGGTGVEDIVRRNIAALRAKANLTQQGLADEMLLRGVAWTRETVAQVETTNRRIGLTEAIAVAACLDVPLGPADRHRRRHRDRGRQPVDDRLPGWPPSPAPPATCSHPRATRPGHGATRTPAGRGGRPPAPSATAPARTCRTRRWSSNDAGAPATAAPGPRGHRAGTAPGSGGRRSLGRPAAGGRAHRAPPAPAGDGRRRRQHRTEALVTQPRGRARAPGHRPPRR